MLGTKKILTLAWSMSSLMTICWIKNINSKIIQIHQQGHPKVKKRSGDRRIREVKPLMIFVKLTSRSHSMNWIINIREKGKHMMKSNLLNRSWTKNMKVYSKVNKNGRCWKNKYTVSAISISHLTWNQWRGSKDIWNRVKNKNRKIYKGKLKTGKSIDLIHKRHQAWNFLLTSSGAW